MIHSKVDLNLFVVLQAIYQHGSITLAAQQLHLTQPAVSHALARLRDTYQDPLFVRYGRKMVATELCQQIMPSVEAAMASLRGTLGSPNRANMLNQPRLLRLGLRDILESIFFPPLMQRVQQQAPNLSIDSRQITLVDIDKQLSEQQLDIVIDVLTPTGRGIKSQLICNEHFSLVCRPDHPILVQLNLANYQQYPHGIVSLKGSKVDVVDMALAKHGITRNVVLRCEHYFAAASVACQGDMLLTMPNSYAKLLQQKLPVVVSLLPFEVPPLPVHMYWHEQAEHDPINNWLREQFEQMAEQLFGRLD
ncbi:LysR family transcriptional regulator [Shewanella sp. WXL01]|uniref:LysR family transcriptional regulator n=1 Tax=Shewanella sp. WXL01 TaxID=2709721 RepID=UPI00143833C9|nr:LysR family transcriptional regulator [Shewanella sp. WXL01]NKF51914.1 LysR family transcriptional regulator [Shewanella sp. WXL01]